MHPANSQIIRCSVCGAANRIPADKINVPAKCGKCHALLQKAETKNGAPDFYKLRCTECGAKNKLPGSKLNATPKCGKCGARLKTEELFAPQPIMVTDSNFEGQILKSPLPVLLFAWAPWCPTCGAVTPIIDQFASDSKGKVRVGKVNVDSNPMLASKYNIMSVPFLFIFDNGQMIDSMPGGMQKHDIMIKMAPYL